MTSQTFMDEVMDVALERLTDKVMTTQELSIATGHAYPTMRKAVRQLEDEGRIIKFDNRARGARYAIAPDDKRPVKIIPNIMFKNRSIPLTEIYLNRGVEDVAVGCANGILQAWASIAITARRLAEGMPPAALVKRINRERVALTQVRNNLEQMVFLCNQILSNEKLWDPVYLANFQDDPDWQSFLPHLEELYSKYFPEASNA